MKLKLKSTEATQQKRQAYYLASEASVDNSWVTTQPRVSGRGSVALEA